jgi:hypothetical protein
MARRNPVFSPASAQLSSGSALPRRPGPCRALHGHPATPGTGDPPVAPCAARRPRAAARSPAPADAQEVCPAGRRPLRPLGRPARAVRVPPGCSEPCLLRALPAQSPACSEPCLLRALPAQSPACSEPCLPAQRPACLLRTLACLLRAPACSEARPPAPEGPGQPRGGPARRVFPGVLPGPCGRALAGRVRVSRGAEPRSLGHHARLARPHRVPAKSGRNSPLEVIRLLRRKLRGNNLMRSCNGLQSVTTFVTH